MENIILTERLKIYPISLDKMREIVENEKDVKQIEAEAEESNIASIRVLEKCNFVPNGETGEEGIRFVWKG